MKINILFGENIYNKLEIEIDEYKNVKYIKSLIGGILKGNENYEKEYFRLIYKNCILNEDKIIKFYKICPNDEIWIGKLETYLNEDDIIVELFVTGWNKSLIHLIVNKNDSIFHIKSKIAGLNSDCLNIWNVNGHEMENDEILTENDENQGYHKLIIGDKCDEDVIYTFDECCSIHDKCFQLNYYEKIENDGSFVFNLSSEVGASNLVRRVSKLKQTLLLNDVIALELNENISKMPSSFVNSQFLFCTDMIDRIWDICNDYWKLMINEYETDFHQSARSLFHTALHVALLIYIKSRKENNADKLIRSTVIDALGYFVFLLNELFKDDSCLNIFLGHFFLKNHTENKVDEAVIKKGIKINEYEIGLCIPSEIKTVIQLKKSISKQTNVPIHQICLMKDDSGEKPNDEEIFDSCRNYSAEIALSMDNIEILEKLNKGAYETVYSAQDKISKKKFILKKPKSNEYLYREINIQNKIRSSQNINSYYGLFCDGKGITIAMEYMPEKSLRLYLKKEKYLPEKEVARISTDILLQIKELHEQKIIHCDINSKNFVFDEYNNVKIIDFGLSKWTVGLSDKELIENKMKYDPRTMFYMAPELIKSHPYTDKADIWSFGVMLIEMIAGKEYKKIYSQINSDCEKVEFNPPEPISDELREFIDSCLNLNPDERFSAKQLLQSKFTNYSSQVNESETGNQLSELMQLFVNPVSELMQLFGGMQLFLNSNSNSTSNPNPNINTEQLMLNLNNLLQGLR